MFSRSNILGIALAASLLATTSAPALETSARFDAANSTTANTPIVHSPNLVTLDLTPGDVIAVEIQVSNATQDSISLAFLSLAYETTDWTLDLSDPGPLAHTFFVETTCSGFDCTPPKMQQMSGVRSKPNDPLSLGTGTEEWLQVVGHTTQRAQPGTAVAGPDIAATMKFVYAGPAGKQMTGFALDEKGGDTVLGPNANSLAAGLSFIDLRFNAADADGDDYPDEIDNCPTVANGSALATPQQNSDGDAFGNACDCDFVDPPPGDGLVLGNDIIEMLDAFNSNSPLHDVNGDGFVLGDDVIFCLARFGLAPGQNP